MEKDEAIKDNPNNIYNKNPKFFVKLPECYDYNNITVNISTSSNMVISNIGCTDKNEKDWYVDKDGYLVINCAGEWSYTTGTTTISIWLNKRLNTYAVDERNTVYAYMITDNGDYINRVKLNSDGLGKNGMVPENIAYATSVFSVASESVVKIRNGIVAGDNEYYPSAETLTKLGTSENAIKVQEGNTVTYKTEIESNGNRISKLNVLCRLPMQNNKSIHGNKYNLHSTSSLSNLRNIRVAYRNGSREYGIVSNYYKILYSTDMEADFDSEFTEYVDGDANINNAKTIQILFSESYVLSAARGAVEVYFDMDMPNTEGISAQISAVKYSSENVEADSILEPAAVYVEKGNPNGTVEVQKRYYQYGVGYAPSGLSLSGIQFKIRNMSTDEILILEGQTDSEGIVQTDSTGKFTLTNVPVGRYEVIEVTEFENYALQFTLFEIINGESVSVQAVNNPIKHKLTIQKSWYFEDAAQQGSVSISIGGTVATTDAKTGQAEVYLPYGSYSVSEKQSVNGWKMRLKDSSFVFDKDHQVCEVENYVPTTTMVIIKTVPSQAGSTDTVDGIKFKVEGSAYAEKYIDINGDEHELNFEKELIVGEDTEGVTQTISNNGKTVTFVINDVYVGNYTITETDMPKVDIEGNLQNKYADLIRYVNLTYSYSNVINIENVWKRGKIKIQKTAEEGVELSQFKFRIYGTSYYGTNVDETVSVDSKGKAQANVYIGNYTIEEVGTEAFNASYEVTVNGTTTNANDKISVKVDGISDVNVEVNNETAYGYVKVVKTLEDNSDVSKVQGIKFYVRGTAPSGRNIKEEIVIGSDGTGTSAAIPAGGEYILYEDENTVPDNYEPMDEMQIDITKKHTQEKPLELKIENKRGKGNLGIETQTYPEGGDVYPIVYKIQEVQFSGENNAYSRIDGTERTIDGDLSGKAYLVDIPAGVYIVEQKSVPKGYTRDIPQIVDVPMYGTANVVFVIEQQGELESTMVRITKKVLNPERNVATDEDYEEFGLDKNESFEVKLTNEALNEEYYAFVSPTRDAVIEGLPVGKYRIEEIYKPKYNVDSYYLVEEGIKTPITAENDKYYIEVGSDSEVDVHIDNIIDDTFGFGAQGSRENLSKTELEAVENGTYTRSNVVVVDENGDFIGGCTFQLFDNDNNKILEFSPTTVQTIIRGLDVGMYTIKNTSVPTGYLKADDSVITVYENAVRIKRIEIQKNVPRGNLTLKTTYMNNDSVKYVPKSKYQIVDSSTGDLLTFTKNADGSYKKSNLADAVDTISLRAGEVTIYGMETSTYEVGIVDIADGFGITEDDVKIADVKEDETQVVEVSAEKTQLVKIDSGYDVTYVLDSSGNLWGWGSFDKMITNSGDSHSGEPRIVARNVKDFSVSNGAKAFVNNDGEAFIWGNSWATEEEDIPAKIDIDDTRFVSVSAETHSMLLLDEYGKIWYSGEKEFCGLGYDYISAIDERFIYRPICLTDVEESPFKDVTMSKVFAGYNFNAAIDTEGRLWTWSAYALNVGYEAAENECYRATCVSFKEGNDINNSYRNGNKIVYVNECFAIDDAGNLYRFGKQCDFEINATSLTKTGAEYEGKKFTKAIAWRASPYNVCMLDVDKKLYVNGDCINEAENSKYSDVEFEDIAINYYAVNVFDKNSNLYCYQFNDDSYGQTGGEYDVRPADGSKFMEYEVALPNRKTYFRYEMKFKKVRTNCYGTIALDYEGNIWTWGTSNGYNYLGNAIGASYTPRIVEFNEDLKFKDVCISGWGSEMYAIDTKGRLWTWGTQQGYQTSGIPGLDGYAHIPKTCLSTYKYNPLADAYAQGVELEEIQSYNDRVVAIDNRGKIWAWGSSASKIVSAPNTVPYCISDSSSLSFLAGYPIKKYTNYYEGMRFVDTQGRVFKIEGGSALPIEANYRGSGSERLPTEVVENGLKFVDVAGDLMLDEYGRVWYSYDLNYSTLYSATGLLQTEYEKGYKIVKLISTYNNNCYGIDNIGRIWDIDNRTIISDRAKYIDVTVYNRSSFLALDEDNHIWVWGDNSYGRLGTGNKISVDEPTPTTSRIKNRNYGLIAESVDSSAIYGTDGYKYSASESGLSRGAQTSKYLTNQGIEIKQELGEYILDTDGKVYSTSSSTITCYTDKNGSGLNNAFYNEGITIEKIVYASKYRDKKQYFLVDSNGRLWNSSAIVGDFEFKRFVAGTDYNLIAEDMDGNYWINGDNRYGLLGSNGASLYSSTDFLKIELGNGLKISKVLYFDGWQIYVNDEEGTTWAWGKNQCCQVGTTATDIIKTPYCWDVKIVDLHVIRTDGYASSDYIVTGYTRYQSPVYVVVGLDEDGAVWSCGNNELFPGSAMGKTSGLLGKVDNSNSMGKIKKLVVSGYSCYAINEQGELWAWGNNYFGALGYPTAVKRWAWDAYTFTEVLSPVCVTKAAGSVYYNKKIDDVIDLIGYICYNNELSYGTDKVGCAQVLVVTDDGDKYVMGSRYSGVRYNSYSGKYVGMYSSSNITYPTPRPAEIDGEILEVELSQGFGARTSTYIRTDVNKIYVFRNISGGNEEDITPEDYNCESIQDYFDYENNKEALEKEEKIIVDREQHKIIYDYKYSDRHAEIDYPSNIDIADVYVKYDYSGMHQVTIIDTDGKIWMKGSYGKTLSKSDDVFVCVTDTEFVGEPAWDNIRGRWNLIYRKY